MSVIINCELVIRRINPRLPRLTVEQRYKMPDDDYDVLVKLDQLRLYLKNCARASFYHRVAEVSVLSVERLPDDATDATARSMSYRAGYRDGVRSGLSEAAEMARGWGALPEAIRKRIKSHEDDGEEAEGRDEVQDAP